MICGRDRVFRGGLDNIKITANVSSVPFGAAVTAYAQLNSEESRVVVIERETSMVDETRIFE
jgi:hypothetical protein